MLKLLSYIFCQNVLVVYGKTVYPILLVHIDQKPICYSNPHSKELLLYPKKQKLNLQTITYSKLRILYAESIGKLPSLTKKFILIPLLHLITYSCSVPNTTLNTRNEILNNLEADLTYILVEEKCPIKFLEKKRKVTGKESKLRQYFKVTK